MTEESGHTLVSKFPTFDPSWSDELKAKWFVSFDQLLNLVYGPADLPGKEAIGISPEQFVNLKETL